MAQQILSTDTFTASKWIVSATASNGTHTTITSAMASASSGDTIFVRAGTYTENFTMTPGVAITAYNGDATTPNVTINGTITMSGAGTCSISNVTLQTNSANSVVVSGSAASILYLINCNFNCSNNTGISYSTSSSSAYIKCYNCTGNLGTTGIAFYSSSSAGSMRFFNCDMFNSGNSTTASSNSAGTIYIENCSFNSPFSTSSTGQMSFFNSQISPNSNTTSLTTAGTGSNSIYNCSMSGGSSSAISIGSGTTVNVNNLACVSTNTNMITGAGTLTGSQVAGGNTSWGMNVTTMSGFGTNRISNSATAVSMSNGSVVEITSITLNPGSWDIYCNAQAIGTALAMTAWSAGISTSSSSQTGTIGINYLTNQLTNGATEYDGISIVAYRVNPSSSTNYYLVGEAQFGSGTVTANGIITAFQSI